MARSECGGGGDVYRIICRYLNFFLERRFEALTPATTTAAAFERDTPLGFPTIKSIVSPSDVVFTAVLLSHKA